MTNSVHMPGIRGTLTFKIYRDGGQHSRGSVRDRYRWVMEIRFRDRLVWHCAFETQDEAQGMVVSERKRFS